MAAPMKRKHEHGDEAYSCNKKLAGIEVSNRGALNLFIAWCHENNFQLSSKVTVSRTGSCAQYGMHAVEDIAAGYCIFQVPRSVLLMPSNSSIENLIKPENSKLTSTNQWIPLLLTLLYESNKPDSKWVPYLALAPDSEAIDLPMFWEKTEVEKLLKGTGVDKAVERDLKMIEVDFSHLVLPFFQNAEGTIRTEAINLESFKRMVAFVMAYSFTEPACKSTSTSENNGEGEQNDSDEDEDENGNEKTLPPMMVPMADMLNHITKHNAKLTFGTEALKMVTTRAIKKGEEIFNTYGQVSNLHLMHMYGFAEPYPNNTNDVVEIPVHRLLDAAKERASGDGTELKLVDSKWETLLKQEIIVEDDVVVLGRDGIVNDDICMQVLKVLSMNSSEYKAYVENEGWSDDASEASDEDDGVLDLAHISQLRDAQKMLLKRMGELHLQDYAVSFEDTVKKLEAAASLPARERFALYTSHGQQMLIKQLINACAG
ncbi:N-lysine methyltransferase setd6-like [Plakobranchus ocellatus]|uniref:N-lysine methyltransferase n=1 Tax=Plakobranchus ocellatus TaxID=259542 RepID=A0AAV4BB55_9GAST|nr:N-lysine methyltransferase setd6-like [Plakobranchus ocellatus]